MELAFKASAIDRLPYFVIIIIIIIIIIVIIIISYTQTITN